MSQLYSFPVGLRAHWQTQERWKLPHARLSDWLLDTGSLTERLQALTLDFEVELLGQQAIGKQTDNNQIIELLENESSLLPHFMTLDWQLREVILYGNGKPWVYARSVLPDQLCQTTWSDLGNQPLGQRIFNDKQFVRSRFEIACLDANPLSTDTPNTDPIGANPPKTITNKALWARRSVFTINDYHLSVAEVFLPDCPCYEENKTAI